MGSDVLISSLSAQVFASRALLIHIAKALDAIFRGHPIAMLYFVMICCPLLMNILQVRPASS